MNALTIEQLKKSYNEKDVLRGVQLTVNEGELFGFVGRNGAGKSTLIHILTGIVHKSSGQFQVFNHNDQDMTAIKRSVGVMPDAANMFPHLRAIEFLAHMARLKKATTDKSSLLSLLASVGLQGEERKKIASFSFGMKKKLSLAQALLGEPKLLFLDEPTSGLDPESSREIQQLIVKLKENGQTVFLTSHNLNEIERICDRMAILHDGRIERVGTLAQLQEQARNRVKVTVSYNAQFELNEQWLHEHLPAFQVSELQPSTLTLDTDSTDNIPEMVKAFVYAGIEVHAVRPETLSLEDIFFQSSPSERADNSL
ncbi:ABC transporter ATP-binding protein [Bacillaceae bacterium SIJ1]|uniref:ABC transporter ATP-binding protein n=1 Tax=Litoribacterium kuwaitense TaxID=1398745 RepID=UPI0013ED81ED|nr:ABC transporter ATP-binding protein [Litoribacterium kuwaitense]NGP45376.1 ABC transporter ATP-binding protein [Litoribacterium kuwaitense]